MQPTHPLLLGLAGTFASGKDTLADYLVEHYNFLHLSTGDMVRTEAMRLEGSIERPVLFRVANELRQTKGAGVFVEIALQQFHAKEAEYNGLVVSGIRSIGEGEALQAAGGTLIFVDAPIEVRYARMGGRGRDQETKVSLDEFRAAEEKESEVDPRDKTIQNLGWMREHADLHLSNGTTLDEFIATAKAALNLRGY